jgi:hypothetical protein
MAICELNPSTLSDRIPKLWKVFVILVRYFLLPMAEEDVVHVGIWAGWEKTSAFGIKK